MVARELATPSSPLSVVSFCIQERLALFDVFQGALWLPLTLVMVCVFCLAPRDATAQQLSESLMAALRAQVQDSIKAAPNHTCQVRIHRVQDKKSLGQKMEELATLEVAYLEGKERFSWPGEQSFRDDDLRDILLMGLSGSGSFAEHLRTVVLGKDTVITSVRQAIGSDGAELHIAYQVPAARSGYIVNLDGKEIEAAIRGVITVRAADTLVLAFNLEAVDLPADFPATSVSESIRYLQPGSELATALGSFRIPALANQQMVEAGTDVYSNEFRFEGCRAYRGDVAIRFDESSSPEAKSGRPESVKLDEMATPVATAPLPPGAPVELRIKSAIVWGKQRTGDVVEAELSRPLKFAGQLLADSGALVKGRLVEFKQLTGNAGTGYYVGIQFQTIENKGTIIPVSLMLDSLSDMPKSNRRGLAAMVRGDTAPYERMDRTRPDGKPYVGTGFIRVLGDTQGIPAGLSMRWVAEDSRQRR